MGAADVNSDLPIFALVPLACPNILTNNNKVEELSQMANCLDFWLVWIITNSHCYL